jgi:GntR family transcriptional repressor for pyruvate dehydrogenase complex
MELANETKTARIANALEKLILEGKLARGSFLPSQQELADQFQTSSRPIREALKLLEAKGLIQITQGRKAQICSNNLDQFVGSLSASLISQYSFNRKMMKNLIQVCTSVLTSAARDFSRSPDRKNTTDKMREHCSAMNKYQAGMGNDKGLLVKGLQQEDLFFQTLVKACNNQILLAIYDNLMPLVSKAIQQVQFSQGEMEKQARNCSYLLEALENGQADLSVALTLVTFNTIESKVLDKIPDTSEALA